MFSEILIFDPKLGFCIRYSVCMMTDFQSALISRIFGVFLTEGFFAQNNGN